jgi:hypothetical protein
MKIRCKKADTTQDRQKPIRGASDSTMSGKLSLGLLPEQQRNYSGSESR